MLSSIFLLTTILIGVVLNIEMPINGVNVCQSVNITQSGSFIQQWNSAWLEFMIKKNSGEIRRNAFANDLCSCVP